MKNYVRMNDTIKGIKRLRKVISSSAKSSSKSTIKEKRSLASARIAESVRSTFKDVELSNAFVAYAKSLLIAEAVKTARKSVIDNASAGYVDCKENGACIFTTEELGVVYSFNKSIANVALHGVQAEIRKTSKKVENDLLDAVIDGSYVVLGTDFSNLGKDFLNVLFGKKAINQFNELVVLLYADSLNKQAKNAINNGVQKAFLDVVDKYIYTPEEIENIDGVEMEGIVSQYYKRYKTRLTELFLGLEGTAYLVKGEIMENVEKRFNEYWDKHFNEYKETHPETIENAETK